MNLPGKDSSTSSEIRLRFAPSPTGDLHLGGARTALFNYLFAKSHQGKFILRIEDTDQVRSTPEATRQVIQSLQWLGIDWDEGPDPELRSEKERGSFGPYFQKKRSEIYQKKIDHLFDQEKIYPCFCSDQELKIKRQRQEAMGVPYVYDRKCLGLRPDEIAAKKKVDSQWVYRFKVDEREIILQDEIKGKIKFETRLIGDFVIRKSDGSPTYNFAVVVDDALMKISHVIRGDDHLSNTPRQILLYQALGMVPPKFYHLSMILGHQGEKLSKRHGATSVLEYKKLGYYPDALINHLALLGWSPEDGVEVVVREKLERSFLKPKFSSSPAILDQNKLDYLNGLYLRNLPSEIILKDFKDVLTKEQIDLTHPKIDLILLHLKDYCKKISDIVFYYQQFISEVDRESLDFSLEEKEYLQHGDSLRLFSLAKEIFSQSNNRFIEPDEFRTLVDEAKSRYQVKGKNFFIPLRLQLTGRSHGIELDLFLTLNDRKKILQSLDRSLL